MMIDDLIEKLIKEETIKKVFTVSKSVYASQKFKEYIYSVDLSFEEVRTEIVDLLDLIVNTPLANTENDIITHINYMREVVYDCEIHKLAYLKMLLLIYVSSCEIIWDYEEKFVPIKLDKNNVAVLTLYRGQSNFSFGLLPSIYRELDYNGIIDYDKLQELYQKNSMLNKYDLLFNSHTIDYSFVSFMQHAPQYSPLLDFSKEKDIALIFATNSQDKNYNSYQNLDCSLYTMSLNSKNNREYLDFKGHNIQFYKEKLKYNSTIFGKPLVLCSLKDFEVDYQTCLFPTNDRMKYQQGAFLYVHKCVIANGKMFFPLSQGFITKQRIYSEKNIKKKHLQSKQETYKNIVQNKPFYDLEHLLDPYLFFSEYNK